MTYRPTCHYAYHPSNDAVLSLHEMFGRGGTHPINQHIMSPEEILTGEDKLGVLLYGHKKNAYWFGSELTIEEARHLAPHQSATGMQVTSAVLAGIVWAIENPRMGIVETDEMDFERCLEVQMPYLGPVNGYYTDWNPHKGFDGLFGGPPDKKDPWQFSNILVRYFRKKSPRLRLGCGQGSYPCHHPPTCLSRAQWHGQASIVRWF